MLLTAFYSWYDEAHIFCKPPHLQCFIKIFLFLDRCEQTEDDSVDLSIELNHYAIDLEGHKRDLEMNNMQICIDAFEYADKAMNAEMDKLALDDMTLKRKCFCSHWDP
jgi:predicted nucleotidyltransferase